MYFLLVQHGGILDWIEITMEDVLARESEFSYTLSLLEVLLV